MISATVASAQSPIPGLFSTGLNATGGLLPATGSVDAHWTLATPYPTSPSGQPVPLPSTLSYGPAYVNVPNGAWLANGPNSEWIMPQVTNSQGGNYLFQTTFTIPSGYNPVTASISGWWSSDNEGIAAYLNDIPLVAFPVPGPSSFNAMTNFTITHGVAGASFQPGLNKLTFHYRNRGTGGSDLNFTDTGFRVQITGSTLCSYLHAHLLGTNAGGGATPSSIFDVSTTTGAASGARSSGAFGLVGIAVHPSTQELYGLTSGSSSTLYKINAATGATTVIGANGLGFIQEGDLAFNPLNGDLYATWTSSGRNLFKLNPATGAATIVGSMGASGDFSALAFNSAGTLYDRHRWHRSV